MKNLIKNITLGMGIYLGWQFMSGVDLALGQRYGDKATKAINDFGKKIVSSIAGEEETDVDETLYESNDDGDFVSEAEPEKSEE